jgi:tetratricopeptide (TPR) repeat protein
MQRKAVRARARSELLKAHDLGDNSDFLRVLLVGIPEDRSAPRFSPNAEVYQFIKQGDAAFGQDNYDAATGAYLKALALDPSNYEAADRRADVFTLFRSPAMPSGKCQCQVRETDIV